MLIAQNIYEVFAFDSILIALNSSLISIDYCEKKNHKIGYNSIQIQWNSEFDVCFFVVVIGTKWRYSNCPNNNIDFLRSINLSINGQHSLFKSVHNTIISEGLVLGDRVSWGRFLLYRHNRFGKQCDFY